MTHETQNSITADPILEGKQKSHKVNHQVKPSINLLKLRNLAEKQKQTHAQHAHHQSTKDEVVRLMPSNAGFKMKIVDKHGSKVYEKEFTDIGQPANFESG